MRVALTTAHYLELYRRLVNSPRYKRAFNKSLVRMTHKPPQPFEWMRFMHEDWLGAIASRYCVVVP